MGTASVTIRVEESTKRAVRAIAEDFGFDISSIARAFYKQIERERKIPRASPST
jgi:DNA-damage-inducible protein J